MNGFAQINMFGSLRKLSSNNAESKFKLEAPLALSEVIERLDISRELIQMVMVNNRAVKADTLINPGDRIALFPREYPLFADWKDFRFDK